MCLGADETKPINVAETKGEEMPAEIYAGENEDYSMSDENRVPWVLGTHLNPDLGPLSRAPEGSRVLMIEAHNFARRKPYHHNKLTIVFSGMRHLKRELEDEGYDVVYVKCDSFGEGLKTYFEEYPDDTLVQMRILTTVPLKKRSWGA